MGQPNVRNFETDSAETLIASCGCNARSALVIQRLVAERDRLRALLNAAKQQPEPEEPDNGIFRINTETGSAWAEVAWLDDGRPELLAIMPHTGWVASGDLHPGSVEAWEHYIAAQAAEDNAEARDANAEE